MFLLGGKCMVVGWYYWKFLNVRNVGLIWNVDDSWTAIGGNSCLGREGFQLRDDAFCFVSQNKVYQENLTAFHSTNIETNRELLTFEIFAILFVNLFI